MFESHTARLACSGKVLLRRDTNGDTLIEVQAMIKIAPVRDPRPVDVVAIDLRGKGLDVTIW